MKRIIKGLFLIAGMNVFSLHAMNDLYYNKSGQAFDDMINPIELCHHFFDSLFEFNYFCVNHHDATKADYDRDLGCNGSTLLTPFFMNTLLVKILALYERELCLPSQKGWVQERPPQSSFFWKNDALYGQACVIPSAARIIAMGDYHGSVHSFARNVMHLYFNGLIDKNGILANDVYVVISGDLADRGHYGVECWALALALKLKNSERVIILQGNHENGMMHQAYGFQAELESKYSHGVASLFSDILFPRLFKQLPQVCFIGRQSALTQEIAFVAFCHAGIPVCDETNNKIIKSSQENIDLRPLLEFTVQQPLQSSSYLFFPHGPRNNGLIWNGFYANMMSNASGIVRGSRGGDLLFHGRAALRYFDSLGVPGVYKVTGLIRGHDHLSPGIRCLFPRLIEQGIVSNDIYWVPIIYTLRGEEEDQDSENIKDLFFEEEHLGYPIFTITSMAEAYGTDAFGIVFYDDIRDGWQIRPHIRRSPMLWCYHHYEKTCWKIKSDQKNKKFIAYDVRQVG
ncbi:MAG: Serine/threonine-protein phosphatase [candidate division TM6 bacterium GW2011_GWF2_38_10]|nr:MAG: Serine/threonine-protein phosphatase [candidate division TM6 bacterium GW2011_GWF2_38_10]